MLTLTLPPRVTDRAFERLAEIAAATGDARPLRVAVEGGGCSGFQYEIKLDEAHPDDLVLEKNGATVLVDARCTMDCASRAPISKVARSSVMPV